MTTHQHGLVLRELMMMRTLCTLRLGMHSTAVRLGIADRSAIRTCELMDFNKDESIPLSTKSALINDPR